MLYDDGGTMEATSPHLTLTILHLVLVSVIVTVVAVCLGRRWHLIASVEGPKNVALMIDRQQKPGQSTRSCQNGGRSLAWLTISPEAAFIDLSSIHAIGSGFRWHEQKPLPYRPWHDGPYHVTMGLKNLNIEDWIEIDDTYLDKYHLKRHLFRDHRDEVLHVLPGCEEGLFEAMHLLKDVLVRRYPTMFRLAGPDVIENLVTGDVWDINRNSGTWRNYHPLEVMGLLATDDFLILRTDPQTAVTTLRGGGVCFPAGFKIEERVGLSLWQIHAGKVPQYESKLSKSMDRFFANLRVSSGVQRFNFAIDDSDELFHRHSHHNLTTEALSKKIKLEDLHLRVERQCLQRLPMSRALLFTIRTYVTPITEVTRDAQVARALRTSVRSFGEDVAKYKNKSLWIDIFEEHVAQVLGEKLL